jgi:hypothetical protein
VPSPCTVTGNLQNLSAGKISQGIVIFELANIGTGNPLGIIGTSLFPLLRYQIQSAPDGSFTTSFRGNDSINPANTIYDNVTYRDSLGNSVGPLQYSIIGASANLNTLVAATTTSPPVLTVGSGFTLDDTSACCAFQCHPDIQCCDAERISDHALRQRDKFHAERAVAGQFLLFRIIENGTGGFTFAWPTNVKGAMPITTAANTVN